MCLQGKRVKHALRIARAEEEAPPGRQILPVILSLLPVILSLLPVILSAAKDLIHCLPST